MASGQGGRGGPATLVQAFATRVAPWSDWNHAIKGNAATARFALAFACRLARGSRLDHGSGTSMIRLGMRIRLTRREAERLYRLTDIEPVDIRTPADLDAYVARCKAYYWGRSRDTQFLHWLIDQERARLDTAA